MTTHLKRQIVVVDELPNGYWRSAVTITGPDDFRYFNYGDKFHDEDEALEWARQQIGLVTHAT